MEFTSIPIVAVCCYMFGEIYKFIFRNRQQTYKLIPVVLAMVGAGIALAIYYTEPKIILATNPWQALGLGIVSGASSTGANQMFKQLFGNKTESKQENKNQETKE